MKSARERAEEAWKLSRREGGSAAIAGLEAMFKEHARDQRHLCAEEANQRWRYDGCVSPSDVAHGAVMNAPAPGEQR